MNFDLSSITINAVVIVPIIIALTQAVKLTGFVKDHFAPLLSIGIGILIAWIANYTTPNWGGTVLSGAIYGLMASGLYSGVRTTISANARLKQERKEAERQRLKQQSRNK
jgi:hypothetical protein